jgi:hypothetical protein
MEDQRVACLLDRLARGMHRTLGKLFHGNQREHGSDVCPVKKRERDAKREMGSNRRTGDGNICPPGRNSQRNYDGKETMSLQLALSRTGLMRRTAQLVSDRNWLRT